MRAWKTWTDGLIILRTDRQTDRDRQTETEIDRQRQTDRDRQIDGQKHKDRKTEKQKDRKTITSLLPLCLVVFFLPPQSVES